MSFFAQTGIKDVQTQKEVWVSEFNTMRTSDITRLVGTPFFGTTKDTNFWTETNTGSGSVTQAAGQVVLATGATANSTTQYQSIRSTRYIPGDENSFRAILKLPDTGTANNTRNWGLTDGTNGFYFQLAGTTLNIVSIAASTPSATASTSWNVVNNFVLDTNYHCYEFKATVADTHFYIDHNLVHTISNIGAATLATQNLNLPVTLQNINSGGSTSNVSLDVAIAFGSRTGKMETESKYARLTGAGTTVLKYTAGRVHRVIMGAGNSSSTVTLYDNTTNSGTVICNLEFTSGPQPVFIDVQAPFFTGLTVTTASAPTDCTIIYE